MNDLYLGLRLTLRALRASEFNLLGLALALAVAAMATVSLFSDRTRLALEREANRLLGADLVLTSSRLIPAEFHDEARARGLTAISSLAFRSMVIHGESNLLSEITAVEPGYPLRGTTRIAQERNGPEEVPRSIPGSGTVWADERMLGQLGVRVGDTIRIGERAFSLAALLTQDPSLTLSVLGMGPRLVMARSDVESTGLVSAGSRVVHRLLVAGDRRHVDAFRVWAVTRIRAGVRVEGVRDARPEVRAALDRAERFMSLAALAAVALAAVAVVLATRRFYLRQLDACAMLRCLGASQGRVLRLLAIQLLGVGLAASAIGCIAGFASQFALAYWLQAAIGVELPQPSLIAALRASAIGLILLLAFGLPPLLGLKRVPALRVLRRELGGPGVSGVLAYALGLGAVAGLVLWHAGDLRLGAYVLLGLAGTIMGAALVTWLGLRLLAVVGRGSTLSWRYGLASLRRRPFSTLWQVVALALGLAALLTLSLVRSDLMHAWQANLPADAPNRFLVNIQADQLKPIEQLLIDRLGSSPRFYPMVRGRLVAVNDAPIDPAAFRDERARRLVEREFNLSFLDRLPVHNYVSAGRWHTSGNEAPSLSVEDGLARTLALKLGDRLTYDVAGERFTAPIASLRKVQWDSFRVNFFVVGPTALLAAYPATHITSFHLPPAASGVLNELVARHPSVVVIDIEALMEQVRLMIGQVAKAITFVFLFTLAAGLLVLYAGVVATHDERAQEVAIMRTLGASRKQITRAHLAEFAVIGSLAGIFAAAGASALGYFIASHILQLPYRVDPMIWVIGTVAGAVGVAVAGMFFTRRVLATPPLISLRQVA